MKSEFKLKKKSDFLEKKGQDSKKREVGDPRFKSRFWESRDFMRIPEFQERKNGILWKIFKNILGQD